MGSVTCISRLDAATSGVLPVALGSGVLAQWFKAQFAGRLVRKEYLCLCHGKVVVPRRFHCMTPARHVLPCSPPFSGGCGVGDGQ